MPLPRIELPETLDPANRTTLDFSRTRSSIVEVVTTRQTIGTTIGMTLLFGSFANVVIQRVPTGDSVVRPGSACPACGHPIEWRDNVPLVSWVVLRAQPSRR